MAHYGRHGQIIDGPELPPPDGEEHYRLGANQRQATLPEIVAAVEREVDAVLRASGDLSLALGVPLGVDKRPSTDTPTRGLTLMSRLVEASHDLVAARTFLQKARELL